MKKFLRNAPKAGKSAYGKVAGVGAGVLASGLALATPKAVKSAYGKVAGVGAGVLASGLALATPTTPGGAIAAELSSGESDLMLVIAAAAVLIGILLLWSYVKRAR